MVGSLGFAFSAFSFQLSAFRIELVNCGRVNVGGRRNSAGAAVSHIGQQEGFAADEHIEASFVIDIATAASTNRLLIFWMLDVGASLGFGTWSLGFRARLVRSSDVERFEESLGVVPIA